MPIRPENRSRYPANWSAISRQAKERARWCCQRPGCTARQYDLGWWQLLRQGGWQWQRLSAHDSHAQARQAAADDHFSRYGDGPVPPGELRPIVIVLTTAHLDHVPEHCDPANLLALCQRHHLAYDQVHHSQTAYMSRRALANTLELPL
jgi:hypothetical protein